MAKESKAERPKPTVGLPMLSIKSPQNSSPPVVKFPIEPSVELEFQFIRTKQRRGVGVLMGGGGY